MSGSRAKFLRKVVRATFPNVDNPDFLKNRYRKMKKMWHEMDQPARERFVKMYNL